MKFLMIIGSLVVLVYGRPEPPSGYQYPSPSQLSQHSQASSYSAPLASVGALSGSRFGRISGSRFTSQGSFSSASSSFSGSAGGRSRYSSRGNGRQYSGNGHSLSDNILVHKHIYVHVPPPEHDEEHHHRKQVHIPAPQKHYKIIFIKAPSAASSVAPIISPLPQNEEKTIVYVLVNKEEQNEIVIPTAAPTEPSRPEVYFIKYKAQTEESHEEDVTGNDDFSQDDTVEVGARQASNHPNGSTQGGAHSLSVSNSSSRSSSRNSSSRNNNGNGNGVSNQYGPPRSSGPY